METPDQRVTPDISDPREIPGHRGPQDQRANVVRWDLRAARAIPDLQGPKVIQGTRESKGHRESKASWANRGLKAYRGPGDLRAYRVCRDPRASRA